MNKKSLPETTIRNVVASFKLEPVLNLRRIREAFQKECFFETIQDRRYTFRVVALRTKKPQATFLIYRTGKVVCVGAKTIETAQHSDQYLANRLNKAGISTRIMQPSTIQNIVATTALKEPIDLEKLVTKTQTTRQIQTMYEPEQFPAAILKISINQNTKATVLLFSSGKLVIAGLKTTEQIDQALEKLIAQINARIDGFGILKGMKPFTAEDELDTHD